MFRAWLITVCFLVGACDQKPENIDAFFGEVFEQNLMQSPQTLSQIRYMENKGESFRHWQLDDKSLAHEKKLTGMMHDHYTALNKYDDAALTADQRLSKRLMQWSMETDFLLEKYSLHDYAITQIDGVTVDYPFFMNSYHPVSNAQEATDYIARLKAVATQFDQVLERVRLQEEQGMILPKILIRRVIEASSAFRSQPAEDNILYSGFKTKLENLPENERRAFEDQARGTIENFVYPAYDRVIAVFEKLEAKASDEAGIWKLPDGAGYYQAKIREQTATDMTAEEIHALGLGEVARIQKEMLGIFAREGYDISLGFEALIAKIAAEERFYFSDDDQGRAEILKGYGALVAEAEVRVADVFNIKPKAGVEVRRVPKFSEKSAPGAYYTDPALDGSRPGIFWANLYDIKATPTYGMRTLTYHEAVPGHHFQIAIAQEIDNMPLFRKYSFYNSYVEGWALYAERLAKELGLQDDPYSDIGRLQAELFRGVRLVVDTGLHHKRWSREKAIDYMAQNTGMALSDVTAEIERYMVWPAQALGYKIGMLKMLELREKAKNELGDKFDIRDFHDVVLKNGAVPLGILEELIDDYIKNKKG